MKVKVDIKSVEEGSRSVKDENGKLTGGAEKVLHVIAQIDDVEMHLECDPEDGKDIQSLAEGIVKAYKAKYREDLMTKPGQTVEVDLGGDD